MAKRQKRQAKKSGEDRKAEREREREDRKAEREREREDRKAERESIEKQRESTKTQSTEKPSPAASLSKPVSLPTEPKSIHLLDVCLLIICSGVGGDRQRQNGEREREREGWLCLSMDG